MSFGWLWYLSVIPVLGLLVFVHELGHFLVGLKMGAKIEEFGFGYPPRMLTMLRYKGVPVTLNWIPLGGFVRFTGEEGNFDEPGSLAALPPRRKIPIMAAGAVMNLLTAMLIFALLAPFGTRSEPYGRVSVGNITAGSPGAAALQDGDIIVAIAGQKADTVEQVKKLIDANRGTQTTFTIERSGTQQQVQLRPRLVAEIPADQGSVGVQLDILSENRLGIRYFDHIRNPLSAVWYGIQHTFSVFWQMLAGLAALIGSLFGAGTRPEGGVAGPVGIGRITGTIAREGGLWQLGNWTALLSVNLALINLLPLPALDGSRIAFAVVEWVRGKRVPPQREAWVHAAGMMLLLGLMLLITFTDVRNIFTGRGPFGQ